MPAPPTEPRGANSLWQPGSRSFFHDPRASRVGDIITVNVSVADAAKLSNTTSALAHQFRQRQPDEFLRSREQRCLSSMDPASLVKMGSATSNVGAGSVDRSESVNLTLAALVTQVLPNGNMVIGGHQQVKVNNELRDLQVTGIVRTEDITSANTVDLSPDRRGAHLLWRPGHGQRRADAALRLAAVRHPDALVTLAAILTQMSRLWWAEGHKETAGRKTRPFSFVHAAGLAAYPSQLRVV